MKRNRFPPGWNEARVRRVLEHYEKQTEDEAVAEDEAAFRLRGQTVMIVPKRLVPAVTRMIANQRPSHRVGAPRRNKALQPRVASARHSRAPGR